MIIPYKIKNNILEKCFIKNIENVIIPDNVVLIKSSAFKECTNIKSVTFSGNSKTKVEDYTFINNKIETINLFKNVDFGDNVFNTFVLKNIYAENIDELNLLSFLYKYGMSIENIFFQKDAKNFDIDGVWYCKFCDIPEIIYYPPQKKNKVFTLPSTTSSMNQMGYVINSYIEKIIFPKDFRFETGKFICPNLKEIEVYNDSSILSNEFLIDCNLDKITCKSKNNINIKAKVITTFLEEEIENCHNFKDLNKFYKENKNDNI